MKIKYDRLTKEEKKVLKAEFKASNASNNKVMTYLSRAKVTSLIGLIYSVGMIIYSLFNKGLWWEYLAFSVLLIFCFVLFIKSRNILRNKLNKFAIEKSKKQSKK